MTLYRRGSVYWSYFYVDGIRHQHSTGTNNRRIAEAVERKLKDEVNLRRFQLPQADPNMTFEELSAHFLARANPTPKPFHVGRIDQLLPFFSQVPIARIDKGLARAYRVERHRRKQLTSATTNRDLACLRHILNWAVEESLLPANPLQRLRLEPEPRVHAHVLSVTDEDLLIAHAPEHLRRMMLMALYCGMRAGEIVGQEWADVDLTHRLLYVSHSKTAGGQSRELPLADCVYEMLAPIPQKTGRIIIFRHNPIVSYKTAWNRLVKEHLPYHLKFHHLRHTFNTRLMKARVLVDVRKDLMGHSQGKQINYVYTHVDAAMRIDAIRQLQEWVEQERIRLASADAQTSAEPQPSTTSNN